MSFVLKSAKMFRHLDDDGDIMGYVDIVDGEIELVISAIVWNSDEETYDRHELHRPQDSYDEALEALNAMTDQSASDLINSLGEALKDLCDATSVVNQSAA